MSKLNRVFAVLALMVSARVFAASYVVPPDRVLAEKSHAIIVGHVTGSHVEKTAKQGIETVYDIAVDETIKGAPGLSIRVREMGGELGNEARIISGAPRFAQGERVLLFLRSVEDGQYTTTDLALGAFHFGRDTAGQDLAVRDEGEIFGWDLDGKPHAEVRRDARKFLTYLREIANAVPASIAENYAVPAHPLRDNASVLQSDASAPKEQINTVFSATSYTLSSDASETSMGFRWRTFPSPVNWNQGNTEPGAPGGGTTAINAAFAAWNGDSCSNVNYVLATSTPNTQGITDETPDGVNNVVFEHNFGSPYSCAGGGLLGVGGIHAGYNGECSQGQNPNTCRHTFNGEIFATTNEVDVSMNQGIANCTQLFTSGNFNTAVTHEVGHTLGFRHSDRNRITTSFPGEAACSTDPNLECSSSAIMTATVTSGLNATLQPWDQHAVRAVYASACVGAASVKGDMNGDGKPDIVWRNPSTGLNAYWSMNGTTQTGIVNLPSLSVPNYIMAGVADFNADGQQDILWQNLTTGAVAVWLMNGASNYTIVNLPNLPPVNYKIEAIADFDGNGSPDLVIRNYSNGNNALWLMNGTTQMSIVNLPSLPNTQYELRAAVDFNGDGKPDILWQNTTTGLNAIWIMNGFTNTSIVNLPNLPPNNFKVQGAADYDGNGTPDLLIRNFSNGNNALWLMNGTNFVSIFNLPSLPVTNYEIRGPR
jgi:hypothetical protein